MTGQTPEDYSVRQGAYDLLKLRGKQLVIKPGRTRRYHVPEVAARAIAALLTVHDKVIAPLIAESAHHDEAATQELDQHRPRLRNHPPRHANLFSDLAISTTETTLSTTCCR